MSDDPICRFRTDTSPRAVRALLLALITAAATLAATGCSWFGDDGPPPTLPAPAESNIAYGPSGPCSPGDPDCAGDQTLDIYRSTAGDSAGPSPVVVWIHGGGFVGGDKSGVNAYLRPLLENGWDIVAINYRLTTDTGVNEFPTAIRDAKRAVRWIRANADDNGWDPQRVAAVGHSAGGNIVGFLAVTAGDPDLDAQDLPPDLAAQSAAITAGVALNPVADMDLWSRNEFWTESVQRYVGCSGSCAALFRDASVQDHVDGSAAPLLAIFGARDGVAPPQQGELLRAAYDAAGVPDRLDVVIVDDGPEKWLAHEPDVKRLTPRILEFLDAQAAAAG